MTEWEITQNEMIEDGTYEDFFMDIEEFYYDLKHPAIEYIDI